MLELTDVSDNLFNRHAPEVDIVHANADFAHEVRPTDHEPIVARFGIVRLLMPLIFH